MAGKPLVVVRGYREADRAFRAVGSEISGEFRDEMKSAAEPIAADARAKLSRYIGASVQTIRPIALARGVVIRQTARKITGKRPDFGALQMTRALIPARDENEDAVIRGLENALDRLTREEGF
jgi:hypothetical protein